MIHWSMGWGEFPHSLVVNDVPAVVVDLDDNVYSFVRGSDLVVVMNRDGMFLRTIGEGLFVRPHGLSIDVDGNIVCVDDEGHQVYILSPIGEVVRHITAPDRRIETGYIPGFPDSVVRSADPFCFPTHALHEGGWLTVSDGYGNSRIHVFDSDDHLHSSWGNPGSDFGEFVIPHGLYIAPESGHLAVCDRENERIQWFDKEGKFVLQWLGLNCPNNMASLPNGNFVVAELGRRIESTDAGPRINRSALPPRITIRDFSGNLLLESSPPFSGGDDHFFSPHGIAANSIGEIFVGEVRTSYPQGLAPSGSPMLHKITLLDG